MAQKEFRYMQELLKNIYEIIVFVNNHSRISGFIRIFSINIFSALKQSQMNLMDERMKVSH